MDMAQGEIEAFLAEIQTKVGKLRKKIEKDAEKAFIGRTVEWSNSTGRGTVLTAKWTGDEENGLVFDVLWEENNQARVIMMRAHHVRVVKS